MIIITKNEIQALLTKYDEVEKGSRDISATKFITALNNYLNGLFCDGDTALTDGQLYDLALVLLTRTKSTHRFSARPIASEVVAQALVNKFGETQFKLLSDFLELGNLTQEVFNFIYKQTEAEFPNNSDATPIPLARNNLPPQSDDAGLQASNEHFRELDSTPLKKITESAPVASLFGPSEVTKHCSEFFSQNKQLLNPLRELLGHSDLGELEQAEKIWSQYPVLLTAYGTIYHPNQINIEGQEAIDIPFHHNPGRYKCHGTAWQFMIMNGEFEEAVKMAQFMGAEEKQKQFSEIFPDGKIFRNDWDFNEANRLLHIAFYRIMNDELIDYPDLDKMSQPTRDALYKLHDYVKPRSEHKTGLLFDFDIYLNALRLFDRAANLANETKWARYTFWCIRVEEWLAACSGTRHLRHHSQGIERKTAHRKGCILNDGSSYFAFRRPALSILAFNSFLSVDGDEGSKAIWVNGLRRCYPIAYLYQEKFQRCSASLVSFIEALKLQQHQYQPMETIDSSVLSNFSKITKLLEVESNLTFENTNGYRAPVLTVDGRPKVVGGSLLEDKVTVLAVASVDAQSELNSRLIDAAKAGKLKKVTELLANKADVRYANRTTNDTALHWAAYNGYTDITNKLLLAGADINHAHADGHTALKFAEERGYHAVIVALIEAGADFSKLKSQSLKLSVTYACVLKITQNESIEAYVQLIDFFNEKTRHLKQDKFKANRKEIRKGIVAALKSKVGSLIQEGNLEKLTIVKGGLLKIKSDLTIIHGMAQSLLKTEKQSMKKLKSLISQLEVKIAKLREANIPEGDLKLATKLGQHIAYGELDQAKAVIEANIKATPVILTLKVRVTDYSNRELEGTALQIAFGEEDVKYHDDEVCMVEMLIPYMLTLPNGLQLMAQQIIEQFPDGWEEAHQARIQRDLAALNKFVQAIADSSAHPLIDHRVLEAQLEGDVKAYREHIDNENLGNGVIRTGLYCNAQLISAYENAYLQKVTASGNEYDNNKIKFLWNKGSYPLRYLAPPYAMAIARRPWKFVREGKKLERNLHHFYGEDEFFPLDLCPLDPWLSSNPFRLGYEHGAPLAGMSMTFQNLKLTNSESRMWRVSQSADTPHWGVFQLIVDKKYQRIKDYRQDAVYYLDPNSIARKTLELAKNLNTISNDQLGLIITEHLANPQAEVIASIRTAIVSLSREERIELRKRLITFLEMTAAKYISELTNEDKWIEVLRKHYLEKKAGVPFFETLRISESGKKVDYNTKTWKSFMNIMKTGNFIKQKPDKGYIRPKKDGFFTKLISPIQPAKKTEEGRAGLRLSMNHEDEDL